uniref:Uncharacterized protein n=1 Tax=Hyaloperonospora arabidopsidis (strain Emoy2) TaxID=559515 RepID=M4BIY7_HYAAE
MGTRRPIIVEDTGTEETCALSAWPGGRRVRFTRCAHDGAGGGGVSERGNGGARSVDTGCARGSQPAPDVERQSRSPANEGWRRDYHRSKNIRTGCCRRFSGGDAQQRFDEPDEVGHRYVADYDGQGFRIVGDFKVDRRNLSTPTNWRVAEVSSTRWRDTPQYCRLQGWELAIY